MLSSLMVYFGRLEVASTVICMAVVLPRRRWRHEKPLNTHCHVKLDMLVFFSHVTYAADAAYVGKLTNLRINQLSNPCNPLTNGPGP